MTWDTSHDLDIQRIRAAIDDPSLELLAWADREEELGNAARAWGLRRLVQLKRKPGGPEHGWYFWRQARTPYFRVANVKPDLLPRPPAPVPPGEYLPAKDFPTESAAFEAAADYLGKYYRGTDALAAAAHPAAG